MSKIHLYDEQLTYEIPAIPGALEIPCQSDKIQILRIDYGTRKTIKF